MYELGADGVQILRGSLVGDNCNLGDVAWIIRRGKKYKVSGPQIIEGDGFSPSHLRGRCAG